MPKNQLYFVVAGPNGKVYKLPPPVRDRHVGVVVSKDEAAALDYLKKRAGLTRSSLIRALLVETFLMMEDDPDFPRDVGQQLHLLKTAGFTETASVAGQA